MQDKNTLCYEGIQRIFRNAIVQYLRDVMCSIYPSDYQEKLKKPFAQEWEKIRENARILRVTGELTTPLKDDFDILSVNHFYNLFDVNYDKFGLAVNYSPQEKRKQKQALLEWLKTIKKFRDPLSHPAESEFTFADSFILLESAKRVLSFLQLSSATAKLEELINKLLKGNTELEISKAPLVDQLPIRELIVSDFIGRIEELKELWEWLKDIESGRWLIAGEGGTGKSALAYNFAYEIKLDAPSEFVAVFWLSAKKRRFLEGSTVDIHEPDFYDLETSLTKLLGCYGYTENQNDTIKQKRTKVLELLNELPALIIIDDIDSLLTDNEDVNEFFSFHAAHTKSKILFTSRRIIFGMGKSSTKIRGFNKNDAEKFIFSRCQLLNIDPALFTPTAIEKIIKVTEASPLYIEELLRLSSIIPLHEAIKQWEDRGGDEARLYAIGRECDLLSLNAKKVLYGACVFPAAVSFGEIEAVVGMSQESIIAALQELQNVFLVPKPSLIEDEQKFEINLNTKSLVKKQFGQSETYIKIQETFRATTHGQTNFSNTEIGSTIRQSILYTRVNKHSEAEEIIQKVLHRHPNNPDLLGVLGRVYRAWKPYPRITDAREKFKRAAQLKSIKVEMYEHWCKMEISQREYSKAIEAADYGRKILPENRRVLFLSGYAHYWLGQDLRSRLLNERAKVEFNEAKSFLRKAIKLAPETDGREIYLTLDIYETFLSILEMTKDSSRLARYLEQLQANGDKYVGYSQWERLTRKYQLPA